jgi:hypothetical protein
MAAQGEVALLLWDALAMMAWREDAEHGARFPLCALSLDGGGLFER